MRRTWPSSSSSSRTSAPAERPRWSAELITSTRTASSAARHREVLEQLDQHLGVDRVAGLGAFEAQQGDARSRRPRSSSACARLAHAPEPISLDEPLGLVGGAARPAPRPPSRGSRKRPEHVGGDDLGVGRVGPPDPDPDPPELGVAEAALEALEAVVAGEAAAEADLDLAEGKVDLVVEDDRPGRAAP